MRPEQYNNQGRRCLYKPCPYFHQAGISLVELMVTAAILMIFGGIAAPALSTFTQSSQLSGLQSEFMASLSLARNESAKRNVSVYIQAIDPVEGNEFGKGWKIWADANKNGLLDTGEPVIRTHAALPATVHFGNGSTNTIQFTPKGYLAASSVIELKLCQAGTNNTGYRITVQYNGLSDVSANSSCP